MLTVYRNNKKIKEKKFQGRGKAWKK